MALYDFCSPAEEVLIDRYNSDDVDVCDGCGQQMMLGLLHVVEDLDPSSDGARLLVCSRCTADTVHAETERAEWSGVLNAEELDAICPF